MTDHYRTLNEWQSIILECRSSGMTDADLRFDSEYGASVYYFWE